MYAESIHETIEVQAYCLFNLTQYLPTHSISERGIEYFEKLQLADPLYFKKNRIDIILGADAFAQCILPEKITHPSGDPTAIKTIFGWMIMGNVGMKTDKTFVAHAYLNFDEDLQLFWEVEECNVEMSAFTTEEEMAEKHHKNNVQRQSDGRYITRPPFKSDNVEIGESKLSALRRLQAMERKFSKE